MRHLAIDFVLLPPPSIIEAALMVNQQFIANNPASIVLNATSCIPHLSMLMGCISDQDLPEIQDEMDRIGRETAPISLHIPRIGVKENKVGKPVSSFEVSENPALQALHEYLAQQMATYLRYRARSKDMYRGETQISPSSLTWINDYLSRHSFEHFWPHITLGYGHPGSATFPPLSGSASRLALCHLGNHCTCREIIYEVILKSPSNQIG